jgi:hypothetical protein
VGIDLRAEQLLKVPAKEVTLEFFINNDAGIVVIFIQLLKASSKLRAAIL